MSVAPAPADPEPTHGVGTPEPRRNGGAYLLHFRLRRAALIQAGRLGQLRLEPGHYVYIGSARRNLAQRVARHRRLAKKGEGKRHWHVDGLLLHRLCVPERVEVVEGGDECALSADLAARSDVDVPVPGFGATDCRAGCRAHLYRLPLDTTQ